MSFTMTGVMNAMAERKTFKQTNDHGRFWNEKRII